MNENETPKDEIQQDPIQNDAPPADSAETVLDDGAAQGDSALDVTNGIKDESTDAARGQTSDVAHLDESAFAPPGDANTSGVQETSTVGASDPLPPSAEERQQGDFPPEPDLTVRGDNNKPFPPAPKLGRDRRTVWANGREYGSIDAAAVALGVSTDIVHARIASSDETFSTYRWGE